MLRILPFIMIIFFSPLEGRAQTFSFKSAFDKHNEGHFFQSLEEASHIKTADGYALSARSRLILVRFYLKEEDRLENIDLAIKDALNALKIDPQHLEGNLQAAVAWGLKARIQGKIKNAKKTKFYINQALKYHPQSPWAWAAHGGWHAEVVQTAGGLLANILLGAKLKTSIASFKKAIELSENPIPFYLAYSQSLLRTKKMKYMNEAYTMLQKTQVLKPQNYLDQISITFAKHLMLAIDEKNDEKLKMLLDGFARPIEE